MSPNRGQNLFVPSENAPTNETITVQNQLERLHQLIHELSVAVNNLGERLYPVRAIASVGTMSVNKTIQKPDNQNVISKISDIGDTALTVLERVSEITKTLQV